MVALDISHKRKRPALRRAQPAGMQNPVVPQSVSGRYRRLKWAVLLLCLGLYYTLPFLRWDRGAGQPDQAVLFDFGLIDYETWANIEGGRAGEPRILRLLRPGTAALSAAVLALAGLMITSIAMRADLKISVVRDSNLMAVVLSEGRIRNAYSVKLSTLSLDQRVFALAVEGLDGAQIDIVGSTARFDDPVEIAPDASRVLRLLVSGSADEALPLSFTVTDLETGARGEAKDLFMLPGGGR